MIIFQKKRRNNENNIENKGLNNEIITDNQNKNSQEQNNENKNVVSARIYQKKLSRFSQ